MDNSKKISFKNEHGEMEEMDINTFLETFGRFAEVCPNCKKLIADYYGKCPACGEKMSESEVTYEKQMYIDELRAKTNTLELANQSIIELAYITMDLVKPCIKGNYKLSFDEANCYLACYFICKKLLKLVDPVYLACHNRLHDFYYRKDNRRLSNDWDRLHWEEGAELTT